MRNAKILPFHTHPLGEFNHPDSFYTELTTRNKHFVSSELQRKIRNLKVFVAGCGAAGGACIEPLTRLGVTQFKLADIGTYELSNLNRQHTFVDQLGKNKAVFHSEELKRINPFADVEVFPEGITRDNLPKLINWADLIIDAVDVTTQDAIQLKFLLHETAHSQKKPVLSPLDPGYCQMGLSFDYRNPKTKPLAGRLEICKKQKDPIRALLKMFPIGKWPAHSLQLVLDLLENPKSPASQLGCSADVFGGVIVATVLRLLETGQLIRSWSIDLDRIALSTIARIRLKLKSPLLRVKIRRLL